LILSTIGVQQQKWSIDYEVGVFGQRVETVELVVFENLKRVIWKNPEVDRNTKQKQWSKLYFLC